MCNDGRIRLIIAGSRGIGLNLVTMNVTETSPVRWLDALISAVFHTAHPSDTIEVVSGVSGNADSLGEEWAEWAGAPLTHFPPDWENHGESALSRRDRQMAEYADALLLIWDGESEEVASMLDEAERAGIYVAQVVMPEGGRVLVPKSSDEHDPEREETLSRPPAA